MLKRLRERLSRSRPATPAEIAANLRLIDDAERNACAFIADMVPIALDPLASAANLAEAARLVAEAEGVRSGLAERRARSEAAYGRALDYQRLTGG